MAAPKLWELIHGFKDDCQSKGWKTSENEDWVKLGGQYHNFLWARSIHASTFKKIAKGSKCAVKKGVSYQVVKVEYTAWLLGESPSDELLKLMVDDLTLAKKTAIYDLSCLGSDRAICMKMNQTNSEVFKAFEEFLQKKFGVKFKSLHDVITAQA